MDCAMLLTQHPSTDINHRSRRNETALSIACRKCDPPIVAAILARKPTSFNDHDENHWTALHHLVNRNDVENVGLLLQLGPDVNAKDKDHNTPLHIAARNGFPPMVQLLIDAKANTNLKNAEGEVPLSIALSSNQMQCAALLAQAT